MVGKNTIRLRIEKNNFMKRKKLFFLWILLLSTNLLLSAKTIVGKVIGVKDGDTIEILTDNKEPITIRLHEVDCPEKKQDYGTKAKQFTSDLCYGKRVTVKIANTDRYGRIVGTVILPDKSILNEELVKAGLAWQYKQYSKSEKLQKLEEEAKTKKLGLWADKNPTPPWEFRHSKKNKPITSKKKVKSTQYNYNDKTIYTGPKGGKYYYNSKGKKVYIKKK